ncbi:AAA family ATPase [Pseudoduganella sp. DS3]|uniref:AAA family ATPase n=1 Tax=Pseudoduganella guangdongensis TaxID=2692179 RepID=A0A6N9HM27_9BURK|nr:TniB family NTP-binding protein [Pseudoduganella guangdongensis]MYN04550.1 AAA family ATPase [Pseudoduganella guangdongensis]
MEQTENVKERWASAPLKERLYYMANEMHVNYPAFVRSLVEIKNQVLTCEQQQKGEGLLLLAPTGVGKSHLSNYLKRLWPDDHEGWKSTIPVVTFTLPSVVTKLRIAHALLRSIQPTANLSHNEQTVEERIQVLLSQIGTRVVIIDNVHDITARRKAGGIKEIGDWLRDIIDSSRRLFILLGAPSAIEIINKSPQLRRRTTRQIRIDYFKINTPKKLEQFQAFLQRLDKELPLACTTSFDVDLTKRIYYATNGIFNYVFLLFSRAVAVAVTAGRESITQEDLEEAFRLVMGDSVKRTLNPFLPNFVNRPLDQEDEPFHDWCDTWDNPLRKD